MENVIGWYHSHPGYGCWLSGIDVGTQMTNQQFQEPFVAIVVGNLPMHFSTQRVTSQKASVQRCMWTQSGYITMSNMTVQWYMVLLVVQCTCISLTENSDIPLASSTTFSSLTLPRNVSLRRFLVWITHTIFHANFINWYFWFCPLSLSFFCFRLTQWGLSPLEKWTLGPSELILKATNHRMMSHLSTRLFHSTK